MANIDPSTTRWRKSSYSNADKECVELANLGTEVGLRDSKNPATEIVRFPGSAWNDFLGHVKGRAL